MDIAHTFKIKANAKTIPRKMASRLRTLVGLR
jgi:hypothetical protein